MLWKVTNVIAFINTFPWNDSLLPEFLKHIRLSESFHSCRSSVCLSTSEGMALSHFCPLYGLWGGLLIVATGRPLYNLMFLPCEEWERMRFCLSQIFILLFLVSVLQYYKQMSILHISFLIKMFPSSELALKGSDRESNELCKESMAQKVLFQSHLWWSVFLRARRTSSWSGHLTT